MDPRIVHKGNAEHYVWGANCDGWRLVDTPGLSVIHERMPPGAAERRHHHDRARQCFFVLQGTLTMALAGDRHVIPAGQALEIAPGATHQAINASNADVEFLVISQPTTQGDRVEEPLTQ
jgi:mannose-6-phosphate isomerase-like protein (cupin superfamily)